MSEHTHDVVIIGGGPAGSTAAALLAGRGWRVAVLEKDRHPRFHIGESLLPQNNVLFERLGVLDEVRRIGIVKNGAQFCSMYHGRDETFYFDRALDKSQPSGFEVHRADLDLVLIRNAAAKGAEVREETRAEAVDFAPDAVTVRTSGPGGPAEWRARFLLDASGRDTFLADRFRIKQANRRHASVALFGHYENAELLPGRDAGNISIYWFDHGWIWFIPLQRGITSVGAVCWPYWLKSRQGSLEEFFDRTLALCPALAARLAGARRIAPVTATGNYSYEATRLAGPNHLLVGDAFAFVDPVFSSGVYLAMAGAFAAADAVDAALRDPASAASAVRRYEDAARDPRLQVVHLSHHDAGDARPDDAAAQRVRRGGRARLVPRRRHLPRERRADEDRAVQAHLLRLQRVDAPAQPRRDAPAARERPHGRPVSAEARLRLLGHRDLGRPIAWRADGPTSAAAFLADVERLASRLPAAPYLVNLCEDRYRFAVAFAAALLAGKTNLFPASRHEHALTKVVEAYADCSVVADAPVPRLADRTLLYPDLPPARSSAIPEIAADHPAAIVFTSGSTGAPRPNLKPWGRLVAGARAEQTALDLAADGGFNVVATVPPQHMFGFESSVLLPLLGGGALHPARPLFPRDVQAALEAVPAPRVLVTTPVHIRACVEAGVPLPPLELMLSAAAPLAPALAAQAERRFATRVLEIYGFTEAGQVASRRTTVAATWRTLAGIRLVASGDGWAVEGGPVPGRVPVSDLIRPQDPGTFVLEGRASDLVDVAGKRASLADLNRTLTEIPGVEDGVFHLPSHVNGAVTRLMAFVVAPQRSRREILARLREAIDPAFLPRPLVLVERLPRAATGKLPLEALRTLEARSLGAASRDAKRPIDGD